MSHATADLEYFRCDVCGVYLHREIFCNHRRDCKGLGSTELKKGECRALSAMVDLQTRRLVAASGGGSGGCETAVVVASSSSSPSTPHASSSSTSSDGAGAATTTTPTTTPTTTATSAAHMNVLLSTADLERRAEAAVRRRVADAYQAEREREFQDRVLGERRKQELMDFLES